MDWWRCPMRCERLQALLPAYIDGDLPRRQNQQVSDHLDDCEPCRRELTAQQRALRALDAGRHTVSIDLWADFSRRLQAQSPPPLPLWSALWQPGLAVAAAGVAVALIGALAIQPEPARSPETVPTGTARIASAPVPSRLPVSHTLSDVLPVRSSSIAQVRPSRSDHHPSLVGGRPVDQPRPGRRPRPGTHTASLLHRPTASPQSNEGTVLAMMPAPPALAADHSPDGIVPVRAETTGPVLPASTGRERPYPAVIDPPVRRTELNHGETGKPQRLAMGLAVVEDTAADVVEGEFRRMARGIIVVGGEATGDSAREPGTAAVDRTLSPSNNSSGT